MNIFQQYGIKEVADVTLYSIELDENDEFIDLIDMDGSWKLSYQNTKTKPVASWGIIWLYKFENLIKRLLNKNQESGKKHESNSTVFAAVP